MVSKRESPGDAGACSLLLVTRFSLQGLCHLAQLHQLFRRTLRPIRREVCDAACLVAIQKIERALLSTVTGRSPLRSFDDFPLPTSAIPKSDLTHVTTRDDEVMLATGAAAK